MSKQICNEDLTNTDNQFKQETNRKQWRISSGVQSALARDQWRKLCVCPRLHVGNAHPIRFCGLNAAKSITQWVYRMKVFNEVHYITWQWKQPCHAPLRQYHAFLLKLISFGQGFSFLYGYCCIWLFIYFINIFNKKSCFHSLWEYSMPFSLWNEKFWRVSGDLSEISKHLQRECLLDDIMAL